MQLLTATNGALSDGDQMKVVSTLLEGGLVALPTETVYGLAANALSEVAVRGIYEAKGRPATNPVIVHVTGASQARALTTSWPSSAQALTTHFWPGPLTIILPKADFVPMIVSAGGPTVALRCPKHTVFQALLYDVGVPLAAPSANRSGETSPTTAQHVIESLGQRIHLIVDAGPCAEGIESTVVDLTCEPPRLLRPGPIAPDDLRAFLPDLVLGPERDEQHAPLRSPGLLTKHYAPRTPLRLISSPTQIIETPEPIGLVTFGTDVPVQQNMLHHDLTRDPTVAARQLYTVLHELDARGLSEILVVEPPPTEAWLGVRDRLMRAAASA